jgi:hypothetical protein
MKKTIKATEIRFVGGLICSEDKEDYIAFEFKGETIGDYLDVNGRLKITHKDKTAYHYMSYEIGDSMHDTVRKKIKVRICQVYV